MQKFATFLLKDRRVQRNLLFFIILVALAGILWQKITQQKETISQLEKKAQLAAKVPELEQRLKAQEEEARKDQIIIAQKNQPQDPVYALKGIYIQDNDKYSVINDDVYREGDQINDCVVAQITPTEVVLQEPVTGRKITLILHEEAPTQ